MKYAYVVNNIVQAVTDEDMSYLFGPMLICPDEVQTYWSYDPGTQTFSAPPPPPLTRAEFLLQFNQRMQQEIQTYRDSKFEEVLAMSPGYPDLPETPQEFSDNLDLFDWSWVTQVFLGSRE